MRKVFDILKKTFAALIIIAFLFLVILVIFSWDDTEIETPDPFLTQQQIIDGKLEEVRKKSEFENEELRKEIEILKSNTSKQAVNQQQSENKISELKSKLKSTDVLLKEDYEEQSGVVLDSIAKVTCFLNKEEVISGSGSIWGVGDNFYLVTNKHVLEEADNEGESCMITIARDWAAVASDLEKSYQDNNLLMYSLDLNYTYWELDSFDFAIAEILEFEQPISLLDDVAMVTDESKCNKNVDVGEKIKIIGFPYTGSFSLPTITEGIISSFEYRDKVPYYITSAKIEHGNSGGIAVTNDYSCMIGLPTSVVVGSSESLGRILILTESELKNLFDLI